MALETLDIFVILVVLNFSKLLQCLYLLFTWGRVLGNKSNKSVCSSNKRENQICADAKSRVESNKPLPFCVINTRGYFSGNGGESRDREQ